MSTPKGKHIFGTVKVGDRGQIVISKEAITIFGINPGGALLALDYEEQGISIVKAGIMKESARDIMIMKNSLSNILPNRFDFSAVCKIPCAEGAHPQKPKASAAVTRAFINRAGEAQRRLLWERRNNVAGGCFSCKEKRSKANFAPTWYECS